MSEICSTHTLTCVEHFVNNNFMRDAYFSIDFSVCSLYDGFIPRKGGIITDRICDRISIVVKESRLTKSEFAKRINVSQPHVSRMCSGETQPSDRTISDICREFDVNENWLRHGIGEMKAETTQRQKLTRFFADVLATCPDERSAFVAALDDLPPEFWPMVAELARNYADNLKKEEAGP